MEIPLLNGADDDEANETDDAALKAKIALEALRKQASVEKLHAKIGELTLENDLYERSSVKWRRSCVLHSLCGASL